MYTYVLTDLQGNAFGEVTNAKSRTLVLPLSKPAAASFVITNTNPQIKNVLTRDCLLKVYDDSSVLRFHGPVVATETTPGEQGGIQAAVTAADPSFRLARRIVGKSANPAAITGDKGDIARQIVAQANGVSDTGINATTTNIGFSGTYTPGPYKYALNCINELADSLDGFNWAIVPQEYSAGKIGTFSAVWRGNYTVLSDILFEYGGIRANIRDFNAQRSWNDIANVAYHIPDDGPAAALGVVSATNSASIAARGLYETIVDATNIFDPALRAQLVSEVVGVRGDPRRVVSFTPDFADTGRPGRVPVFGTDYNVGNGVRVRLNTSGGGDPSSSAFVDGYLRIYGVTITIDSNGKTTYTPTTVDEAPSAG